MGLLLCWPSNRISDHMGNMSFIRDEKEIGQFLRYDKSLRMAGFTLQRELRPLGYEVKLQRHPAAVHEPKVKDLIGYWPTGEYQVLVKKDKKRWSIIKCMGSFGLFEIMQLDPTSKDPERFKLLRELIAYIKNE